MKFGTKLIYQNTKIMKMVRQMCGVHLKDRVSNKELRERDNLGIQQNRLKWYGHVL